MKGCNHQGGIQKKNTPNVHQKGLSTKFMGIKNQLLKRQTHLEDALEELKTQNVI